MLQQLTGLALSDITHYEKMWFLTGSGANGKSVFADILTHLVGANNVSHLDIQQIGQRYLAWPLTEHKLNIAHDLAAANCSAMEKVEGVLKQVVNTCSKNHSGATNTKQSSLERLKSKYAPHPTGTQHYIHNLFAFKILPCFQNFNCRI